MNTGVIDIIVKAVISIIGILFTAYIIPWIKNHTTEQQRKALVELIKTAVAAAQQMFQSGSEKKDYVVGFLGMRGISVTLEVDALVEAAVYELKNS